MGDELKQTRPSAIVDEPAPDTMIAHATTVELLFTALLRTTDLRDAGNAPGNVKRELSLAITHLEDAITRVNKAHYMIRGVFGITDAER